MDSTAGLTGLVGVGYQGRDIDGFVSELRAAGVSRLVDVRLTPLSRKPGFSKTALRQALDSTGVAYEHLRELGNPKDNRPGFAAGIDELTQARDRYRERLAEPAAASALRRIADWADGELVAVLCFEAEQARCHRDLVLTEVARLRLTAAGSTPHRC
ncbi:MAG: DUF488 domain-containing protein [Actinocatenispora sp.]